MSIDDWIDIGCAGDVPVRGSRVIHASGGDIAIFRADGDEYFALRDRCPHKGGPLSPGIVAGRSVTCPLHNWLISLETGQACGADVGCTPTVRLMVKDGRLLLRLTPAIERAA
ncbi:MAG TPA: nitrite reductase small subunit NirD [Candidatus Binatia bacterium]|nr:nitrite reductase small subunit NirD [Candidatus Binatia bacterium]